MDDINGWKEKKIHPQISTGLTTQRKHVLWARNSHFIMGKVFHNLEIMTLAAN